MSSRRTQHGLPLPAIGTCAAIAAGVCALWLIWSHLSHREWGLENPTPEPSTSESSTRLQALGALVREGPDAIPELVAELSDQDPRARRDAIMALGWLGRDASDQLELVQKALSDDSVQVRAQAVTTIWRVSRDPEVAVPLLLPSLADPDRGVRDAVESVLVEIRQAETKQWREEHGDQSAPLWRGEQLAQSFVRRAVAGLFRSGSPGLHTGALAALKRIGLPGPDPEFDDLLRELVDDAETPVRDEALRLLISRDAASIAQLREALRVQFPTERSSYAPAGTPWYNWHHIGPDRSPLQAIAVRGAAAVELLPDIIEIFDRLQTLEAPISKNGSYNLDLYAGVVLGALRGMKTAAQPAKPHLLRRISELHDSGRIDLAEVLFEIGASPEDVIAIVAPIVAATTPDSRSVEVRQQAARRAGALLVRVSPEEARRQVAVVIPRLGSGDSVDRVALFALSGLALEAREAVPALIPLVNHPDPSVARPAIDILAEVGPEAAPAVPALVAKLRADLSAPLEITRFWSGITTLGKIGPAAKPAVPLLLELLTDGARGWGPNDSLQVNAILALAGIGESSPAVLQVVRKRLESRSSTVRSAAVCALALLDPEPDAALRVILPLLADESDSVRAVVALEISNSAIDQHAAIAPLVNALGDKSRYVRTAAAISLGKMGRTAGESLPALRALVSDPQNPGPDDTRGFAGWRMDSFSLLAAMREMTLEQAARAAIQAIEGSDIHEPRDIEEEPQPN